MRRGVWVLAGVVVLLVVTGAAVSLSGPAQKTSAAQPSPATTAEVRRGTLSATVAQDGILTYRARPDGSPFPVINRARGTYTALPEAGDAIGCGGVLYRVDDRPVLLLCGRIPAYRALRTGDTGRDVRGLNRTLRVRGAAFTGRTERALRALQRRRGMTVTGALALGDAVVLPGPVRVAKVSAEPGGPAQPGTQALAVTSGTLHVQVNLDPSEQRQVRRRDRARITLPGGRTVTGTVAGFGRIAHAPAGQDTGAEDAVVPTYIRLDDPGKARGLDRAPVQVEIATEGVREALSVPVTALVGRAGGGFAVEAVRAGGQRELVAVTVGLFDTTAGRVQVEGNVRAGDRVAVPSL